MRLFLNVVCGDKYLCNFSENNYMIHCIVK
ncbi:Hypothetical protein FNO222_0817 [Francisella orientalis]|uniref:Uncharacterized protein n=1 Tax=Francisella orientalis TaxID=299583 RepID=A0ABM5U5M8_9GAMM|nr:hypothetical protein FNO12_0813 [Francisella orientalis FNO12]AKN87036.1 Hypothetical protein FNO24_0813 [Francisella orientalis FNO24]AKN88574.1 Hypothetical protein FNO190_0813 [Francisella orientalis]AKU05330.1 Hypothetical protein FNO01_0813 [Francisella orientalis]QEN20240.1 Hypothetical protein FNO39_0817 [Francisella orientalis]